MSKVNTSDVREPLCPWAAMSTAARHDSVAMTTTYQPKLKLQRNKQVEVTGTIEDWISNHSSVVKAFVNEHQKDVSYDRIYGAISTLEPDARRLKEWQSFHSWITDMNKPRSAMDVEARVARILAEAAGAMAKDAKQTAEKPATGVPTPGPAGVDAVVAPAPESSAPAPQAAEAAAVPPVSDAPQASEKAPQVAGVDGEKAQPVIPLTTVVAAAAGPASEKPAAEGPVDAAPLSSPREKPEVKQPSTALVATQPEAEKKPSGDGLIPAASGSGMLAPADDVVVPQPSTRDEKRPVASGSADPAPVGTAAPGSTAPVASAPPESQMWMPSVEGMSDNDRLLMKDLIAGRVSEVAAITRFMAEHHMLDDSQSAEQKGLLTPLAVQRISDMRWEILGGSPASDPRPKPKEAMVEVSWTSSRPKEKLIVSNTVSSTYEGHDHTDSQHSSEFEAAVSERLNVQRSQLRREARERGHVRTWKAPIQFWKDARAFARADEVAVCVEDGVQKPRGKRIDGFTFEGHIGDQEDNAHRINRLCNPIGGTMSMLRTLGTLKKAIDRYQQGKPGTIQCRSLGVFYVGQSDEDERQLVGRGAERVDKDHFVQLECFTVKKIYEGSWAITKAITHTAAFLGAKIPSDQEVYWHCPAVTTVCLTHGDPVEGVVSKFNWAGLLNLDSRIIAEILRGTQKAVQGAAFLYEKPLKEDRV